MPKLQNTSLDQNLTVAQVWVTDTDPTSRYFRLTQLPDTLTAGKNAFLINGSPELVGSTRVLVELKDSAGNVVFSKPIRNFTEGLARIVSIEVYQDTAPGMGKLTILGEIHQDAAGNLPPDMFRAKYNVKWERDIAIAPTKMNVTPIRTYRKPKITVAEILTQYKSGGRTSAQVTGSGVSVLEGAPATTIQVSGLPSASMFVVQTSVPTFTKDMEGGTIRTVIGSTVFSAGITAVLNNTMAYLDSPYTVNSIPTAFQTTNYTMSYSGSIGLVPTMVSRSYADIRLTDLKTFSGQFYRAKIFVSPANSTGDRRLLSDIVLNATEFLETASFSTGEEKLWIGRFTSQSVANTYWESGLIVSGSYA